MARLESIPGTNKAKIPEQIRYELNGGHIEFIPLGQLTCINVDAPKTDKKYKAYSVIIDPETILDLAVQVEHYRTRAQKKFGVRLNLDGQSR